MKFCWVTLHVKDMEESLKFYQEIIELKINRRFNAGPDMEIAFLGDGETEVELIYSEKDKDIDMGKHVSLGFEVDSVDEMITFIKEKGLEVHSGPVQPSPATKFFYIMDPNGLKIQFVENIK